MTIEARIEPIRIPKTSPELWSVPRNAAAIPPPRNEPKTPSVIVNGTLIGSGPGTAQRARPPMMKPESRTWMIAPSTRATYPVSGRGNLCGRLQLAPQVLDLVAQLGRVLEAQLLGGGEHLLLELDHELLDLGRLHVDLLVGAPAAALGGHLGVRHQELRDVRDALDDRLGRDAGLLVLGDLDRPATVGLVDRRAHRRGLLVGVHEHGPADVARGAPDGLDQR